MVVSVLRIGPLPSEQAELLLASIENHLQQPSDQLETHSSHQQRTLHLDNKYFTANVRVVDVEHEILLQPSSKEGEKVMTRDDGILLAFDAPSASAFDSVASLHMLHEQELGDLLRLCVGVSSSSNAMDDEKEYSRRVLWCLDHGYEYVEADLSEDGVSRGHEERDKDGFARIIEAIEGTVWSSAVMKTKRGQKIVQTYQQQCAENDPKTAASDSAYIPPVISPIVTCEEDQDRELRARQALLPESANDDGAPASCAIEDEHKSDGNLVVPEHIAEREEERTIDAMEHTITEAKRIRESSRSGELSNDERQRRAGDAAALLMNLMGQMGMDDSEDDGEE